jgi:Glycosyl hydrolases family 39/Transmembrane protein 131-like N-terminal
MSWFDHDLTPRHTLTGMVTVKTICSKLGYPIALLAVCWALALATGCGFHINGSTSTVSLIPASSDFGNLHVGQASTPHKLTLINKSTHSISISSLSTSMHDFVASSDCPSRLAPIATCTVTVVFTPVMMGTRSGTVVVAYTGPGSPATASLTGTGTTAPTAVSISPTSLSWTNILVGQTSPAQDVTLTNLASSALTISSISVGSPYTVTSTTCPLSPSTLAGRASCTISVAFRPLAAGPSSGNLTVSDSDSSSPQQVALSGTAIAAPVLFSPTSLSFPSTEVGTTSPSQTATLTNQESNSVAITSIATTADFTQTNNCPATLAANASCTVSVAFAPASSGGKTGSVIVTYPSGTLSLSLSGTASGSTGGTVTVSPTTYTFPNQAIGTSSAPATITLSNGQSTPLSISSIQINPPFSQTNNCGVSLAAGMSCAISVIYSPKAAGLSSSNLVITDNATNSPQTVAISGSSGSSGQKPVSTIPVAGGLYFYNQIVLTQSTPQAVTITNNQSIPLTISAITSTADYPFTTDCIGSGGSGTLAAQASCTVQISFFPQAVGKRAAALTITHNAAGSPIAIPLTGTGIAGDLGLTVTVGPPAPCTVPSGTQQFTAFVSGTTNTAVKWYVNNVLNGNSRVGTITANGLYTAPPTVGTYGIKAISQASTSVYAFVPISVSNSPIFTIYPFTSSIPVQGQQTFQPQICTAPDSGSVTWTVDGVPGGNSTVGTISNSGVYTAPAVPGKHTVRVTDTALNKSSGAVVTVFSNVAVDFGSRTTTTYPLPSDMFGAGRGEAFQSVADRSLLTQAGVTVSRLYAQIPLVYATETPDWTKIDPFIASIQAAGQKALLQMSLTPPWLQPNPNPCGAGEATVAPSDPAKWAQIAAAYVAHMDATFPGVVQDYEIWNEPNATGICTQNHLKTYLAIYAAAAPLMKKQAATDGATIRVGGPALSGYSAYWLTPFLSDPTTAPYIDFVSYHQYMFGKASLQVQWDTYNGNTSLYQETQDSGNGAQTIYNRVFTAVKAGKQPLGANTPIYITEFNTNWSFNKDCCRNDPTYGPIWNALYITDLLNSAYLGIRVPGKMIYFAGTAYPWICMVGVIDPNLDCLYSSKSVPQPYPQYYAYQLLSSRKYLGLMDGGYLAKSVAPPSGAGGLAVTAFYNASQDAILITNPTSATYSQMPVSLQNVGFGTPHAMLYQIVSGALINSSSLALTPQGTAYSATVDIPPYSVQAISVTGP